jgi:hypothetical protein
MLHKHVTGCLQSESYSVPPGYDTRLGGVQFTLKLATIILSLGDYRVRFWSWSLGISTKVLHDLPCVL